MLSDIAQDMYLHNFRHYSKIDENFTEKRIDTVTQYSIGKKISYLISKMQLAFISACTGILEKDHPSYTSCCGNA